MRIRSRPNTQKIYKELCEVIPGGVNSPVRACRAMEQLPLVVDYAEGDMLYDVDGHAYIDYCGSWGALVHGHAHPILVEAIQKRAALGTSYGITTALEKELATEVIRCMPSIESIRFVSSGTEATMSAIRLARGYTRRELIVKFDGHYHGHADAFLVKAGSGVAELSESSSQGIPQASVQNTLSLPFNDLKAVEKLFNSRHAKNIAAVILEPIAGNMGVVPAEKAFLNFLRKKTQECGALLILDEVISGFRVALGGAQSLYGIQPDLTCLGKIVGGGLPAAAFGGRREIMEQLAPVGPIYQAGTLSGNPLAMAAGLNALKLLQKPHFYENLQKKQELLIQPIIEHIQNKNLACCVQAVGSMFTLFFGKKQIQNSADVHQLDTTQYKRFFQYLFQEGIYFPPSQHEAAFISSAHSEENLKRTRDTILNYLKSY